MVKRRPRGKSLAVRLEGDQRKPTPGRNAVTFWSAFYATADSTVESRGNTGHGWPAPVGSIGLALALRARVVRGL
jgi:hypothetical protein